MGNVGTLAPNLPQRAVRQELETLGPSGDWLVMSTALEN